MRAIGIRVAPKVIYFSICEFGEFREVNILEDDVGIINIPVSFDTPNKLTFVRQTLYSIINEYNIEYAGIRVHEGNTQNISVTRLNIEGVVQELLANSTVKEYFVGTLSTLSKYLHVSTNNISDAIKGKTNLDDIEIEGWESMKKEQRESLLTSIAALSQ